MDNIFNLVDKTSIGTAIKTLGKESPIIDGLICAYRTKDGEFQVMFANVDAATSSFLINVLQWSLQQSCGIVVEGESK